MLRLIMPATARIQVERICIITSANTKTSSIVLPRSPRARTPFDLLDLLLQAGHDPVAGDVQGPGRQAQLGGDQGGFSALDGGAPIGRASLPQEGCSSVPGTRQRAKASGAVVA